ncbi:MAG TPA: 50S ribosomal protein L11 methyltransferase, partial [Polyangiaceae bacterium]|nr:50S ribosomal protein L11 methyltransferase [Polyangiaceae bacterium]
ARRVSWTEIAIVVEAADGQRAAEALAEEGMAVEERDGSTLLRADPGKAMLIAWAPPAHANEESARIERALRDRGVPVRLFLRERDDEGWLDAWKAYFQPREIGPFAIVPTFYERFVPARAEVVIRLDPGRAFGTGGHASTRICLEAIGRLDPASVRRVLDVGCGSGVLAIAALLRSPSATATAIDLDGDAIEVTRENAQLNRVADRIAASTTPLAAVAGAFDAVLANLTADVLAALADDLAARLAPDGRLIVGGVLFEQADDVIARFVRSGLRHVVTLAEDEWVAIELAPGAR